MVKVPITEVPRAEPGGQTFASGRSPHAPAIAGVQSAMDSCLDEQAKKVFPRNRNSRFPSFDDADRS
jgi:hypothetical protein